MIRNRRTWLGLLVGLAVAGLVPLLASCPGRTPTVDGTSLHNFDEVDPGKLYRSAQPIADALDNVIPQLGIRTIINLRGANPGEIWYDAEKAICQKHDVALVDHPMSAHKLPSPELLSAVLASIETAEPPVLIHCQAGADRTGAIAAIYRMKFMGHAKADALKELSIEHLHIRQYAPCMDTLAEAYEPTDDWMTAYADTWQQMECK